MDSPPSSRPSLPALSKSDADLKRYLETTNSTNPTDTIQHSYPTPTIHSFMSQLNPQDTDSISSLAVGIPSSDGYPLYGYGSVSTDTPLAAEHSSLIDPSISQQAHQPRQSDPAMDVSASLARTSFESWPLPPSVVSHSCSDTVAPRALDNTAQSVDNGQSAYTEVRPPSSPISLHYSYDSPRQDAQALTSYPIHLHFDSFPKPVSTAVTSQDKYYSTYKLLQNHVLSSIPPSYNSGFMDSQYNKNGFLPIPMIPFPSVGGYNRSLEEGSQHDYSPSLLTPAPLSADTESQSIRRPSTGGTLRSPSQLGQIMDMHLGEPSITPPPSSLSHEPSTPVSAFSVGSLSPLGARAITPPPDPPQPALSMGNVIRKRDTTSVDNPALYSNALLGSLARNCGIGQDNGILSEQLLDEISGSGGAFVIPSDMSYSYPSDFGINDDYSNISLDYSEQLENDRGLFAEGQRESLGQHTEMAREDSAVFPLAGKQRGVVLNAGEQSLSWLNSQSEIDVVIIVECIVGESSYVSPALDRSDAAVVRGRQRSRGRSRARARVSANHAEGSSEFGGSGSSRNTALSEETRSRAEENSGPNGSSEFSSPRRGKRRLSFDDSSSTQADRREVGHDISTPSELKRARKHSDSTLTPPLHGSATQRLRAPSLLSSSKAGCSGNDLLNHWLPRPVSRASTSKPYSPSPLNQSLPAEPSPSELRLMITESSPKLNGRGIGRVDKQTKSDVDASNSREPDEGEEESDEESEYEEEDESAYEDDDNDEDYVQGRSSGRTRGRSSYSRKGRKGHGRAQMSAALALHSVQAGSARPVADNAIGHPEAGAGDGASEVPAMFSRNGRGRRRRTTSIPLPVPVPNLTKKSRGRKVPAYPVEGGGQAYGSLGESSQAGVESDEDQYIPGKRSPRGRKVPVITEGPGLEDRPFVCEVAGCSKRFVRGEHLKRHVRSIHTHDKPYVCPYKGCGKSFSRRDNLGQHARVHL